MEVLLGLDTLDETWQAWDWKSHGNVGLQTSYDLDSVISTAISAADIGTSITHTMAGSFEPSPIVETFRPVIDFQPSLRLEAFRSIDGKLKNSSVAGGLDALNKLYSMDSVFDYTRWMSTPLELETWQSALARPFELPHFRSPRN